MKPSPEQKNIINLHVKNGIPEVIGASKPATKLELAAAIGNHISENHKSDTPVAPSLRQPEPLSSEGAAILGRRQTRQLAHAFDNPAPMRSAMEKLSEDFLTRLNASPIVEAVTPERQRDDKHYFTVQLTESLGRAGVYTVRAVAALNPNALPNLVRQEGVILTSHPEDDEEYSVARMYAELFAFMRLWDEWLEGSAAEGQKKDTTLHHVLSLLSAPLIALLERQTAAITTNHEKILDLLAKKASTPENMLAIVKTKVLADETYNKLKPQKRRKKRH